MAKPKIIKGTKKDKSPSWTHSCVGASCKVTSCESAELAREQKQLNYWLAPGKAGAGDGSH